MESSKLDGAESVELLLDPETEFLASKEETGNEWELFKENVRPLKRGRDVRLLNHALKSHSHSQIKNSLLQNRRRLIQAIDEYTGDDPLHPWLERLSLPGGDYSGLVVIYEQCVRTFWHEDRYKDDLRYLKVWLEYAENCVDAEDIFWRQTKSELHHSTFPMPCMEHKNKNKTANVQPWAISEDATENHLPARSFGTVLTRGTRNQTSESSDLFRKKQKPDRAPGTTFSIFKDNGSGSQLGHQSEMPNLDIKPWHSLGARAERNKENNAIPSKWTSNKIPQRPGQRRARPPPGPCIEIFVDEESQEQHKQENDEDKSSVLQLRPGDGRDLKKETELLRENPLRNFPISSLPR
ncbi:UNVERIFIED_CONTAM: Mitotic spindle checkpoint protein BUBR1 [Sesamum radiatum]|uniref:Mitotic spindle checkpoint protein BUBR1 n=1 Tax=Sesamum radiatum TaxID=300843 RepID=A0AAW2QFB2_SESRA